MDTISITLNLCELAIFGGISGYWLVLNRRMSIRQQPGFQHLRLGLLLLFCAILLESVRLILPADGATSIPYWLFYCEVPLYLTGAALMLIGFYRRLPAFTALRSNARLLQSIVNAIPVPTFFKNNAGFYLGCNDAFADYLGLPKEGIIGKTVYDIAPRDLAEVYEKADRDLIRQGGTQTYETNVQYADGSRHDVIFHKAVFTSDNGKQSGLVGTILDITERKESERVLRELDRIKNEFISTAAHELRTPLTSILGYSEILANPHEFPHLTDDQGRGLLDEIHRSAEHLAGMVEDLLDLGRMETGQPMPIHLEEVDPETILRRAVDHFAVRSARHSYQLHSTRPESGTLTCDPQRLQQVLENLLANATKYSPGGGPIEIDARVEQGRYQVSVRDHGIGMSEAQRAKAFDKFYRADASDTAVGGLGLGMSIVRTIVLAHGGDIDIESSPGAGTCVRFWIPLTAPAASVSEPAQPLRDS